MAEENEKHSNATPPSIVVLGAGIIGLTAAHRLATKFPHSCLTIVSKTSYTHSNMNPHAVNISNTYTSAGSGGLWMEIFVEPQKRTKKWALLALREFRQQASQDGIPGVGIYPGTLEHSGKRELPWWADECNLVEEAGKGILMEKKWSFSAPIINMDAYLPWLEEEVTKKGVKMEIREEGIGRSIGDVCKYVRRKYHCDVLVNCTGLGAGELCNDSDIVPGRGVTVKVLPKEPLRFFYAAPERGADGELTYVFPRGDRVTCGGCCQEGSWNSQASEKEVADLLNRCKHAVPHIKDARIEEIWTGFRPLRKSGVRLELEYIDELPVIHSYGHGGAGVTVSWGCAEEVASILEGEISKMKERRSGA